MKTNFQKVAEMNNAFGNAKGDPKNIDWTKVRNQCRNIPDELGELFIALGADPTCVKGAVACLKATMQTAEQSDSNKPELEKVRDALCDLNVFSYGAHHLMGIDADRDMQSVLSGVMTRFVKNEADLKATKEKHSLNGVIDTYTEGEFPTMILKSSVDQPDAPKGKFLKSASYKEPQFYSI